MSTYSKRIVIVPLSAPGEMTMVFQTALLTLSFLLATGQVQAETGPVPVKRITLRGQLPLEQGLARIMHANGPGHRNHRRRLRIAATTK